MPLANASTDLAPRQCPHGNVAVGGGALAGLCPRCLLEDVLDDEDEDEPEPSSRPVRCGAYVLGNRLGGGAMGVVYEARHRRVGLVVALKLIRDGELADAEARRRFLNEARAAAKIQHSNVVRMHHAGQHDGQLYFTMDRMTGGTLREVMTNFPERFAAPRAAATLISTLARAVHEGHRQGIIHRDLKPENVLFDDVGKPYIADFGVAKHLDQSGDTSSHAAVGTCSYMAPEQARGRAERASDVWSLGVMLYELLTGKQPFSGPTPHEVLRRSAEEEPAPLERLRGRADRSLAMICFTCLRKEPMGRYISAGALADDLDRYCNGQPILGRPVSAVGRVLGVVRRHPARTLGLAASFALLLALVSVAISFASAREKALIAATQKHNAWDADVVASTYLKTLEPSYQLVAEAAENAEIESLLSKNDRAGVQGWLTRRTEGRAGYCNWNIIDGQGNLVARAPEEPGREDEFLGDRDYFQGTEARAGKRGRDSVYVSKVFTSRFDFRAKFAISAPIWTGASDAPKLLGVLSADIASSSYMGLPGRKTALVAPVDHKAAYQFFVHPDNNPYTDPKTIDETHFPTLFERLERLRSEPAKDDDYVDPVTAPEEQGANPHYLAAFAAVGDTGFVAIVQEPYDDLVAPDALHTRRLLAWSGAGVGLILALGWWIGVARARRQRDGI